MVSTVLAVIASVITYFVSAKGTRKRRLIVTIFAPFAGLYTLYFCAVVGSLVVSEVKEVDIGIGDTWYVPLPNGCQLLFIDLPEQASIQRKGQTIIADITQLQEIDRQILGKTSANTYFSYSTQQNVLKEFATAQEWLLQHTGRRPVLLNAQEFYTARRNDIAGTWLLVVGILSLFVSGGVVWVFKRLVWK